MDDAEFYRLQSFLDRSHNRLQILTLLEEKGNALRPTDIAKELDTQRETISRRITDLRDEGLVKVMNPDDNRNRYYKITDKGKTLLHRSDLDG